jgi:hypothetical protein
MPSPSGQSVSPRQQNTNTPKPNTNPLVFKNSTSAYPHGAAAVPSTTDSNIFALSSTQPPSNLHSNTNADYFSSTPPTHAPPLSPSPPTPPHTTITTTTDSANPFNPTFPLTPSPPTLDLWRAKLFNIPTPIHLTESQFLTYFPHIDNVYSHRSTQKYKRKPFVSHYWDCRLKGRPSGTKKSDDPNKKRRKREKRERDLCDVKIKITEWFGREEAERLGLQAVALGEGEAVFDGGVEGLRVVLEGDGDGDGSPPNSIGSFGVLEPKTVGGARWPKGHPGADGKKWYTIQRVNGSANAATNNKKSGAGDDDDDEDSDAEGDSGDRNLDHKHTLEDSDRIKKNSVQRWLMKEEKERRMSKKVRGIPIRIHVPFHPSSFPLPSQPFLDFLHLSPPVSHFDPRAHSHSTTNPLALTA